MSSPFEIQRALQARGYDPGPVDGIWGRRSIAALNKFQAANNLDPDGIPGRVTVGVLNAVPPAGGNVPVLPTPTKPVWYAEAERLMGIRETPGAASNPIIMSWPRALGKWVASVYKSDATPWCGLFVGHVIGATLPQEALPANPLSALAWAKFGRRLAAPSLGAICVFTRTGGGHVGFYAGEDAGAIHVLGGNQSDQVCIIRKSRNQLQAMRWPASAPTPIGGRIQRAASGSLSQNEA